MDDSTEFTLGMSNSTVNDTFISTDPIPLDGTSALPGYCGADFKAFGDSYKSIHGFTSLTVCLFGALGNILNLIVLTRKEMINPTNAILTGLALSDVLNMLEYIPFTIYMNFLRDSTGSVRTTYGWALFVLTHSNFSQVCHTISIWLTVTLAVWRYIMVAMPLKCRTLCSMERAKWAIGSAYVTSPILCIPIYLTFSVSVISPLPPPPGGRSFVNGTLSFGETNLTGVPPPVENARYIVNLSELARRHPFLMTANFWLYSVVIKILPCILLTVVSLRLVNSLMEAKKRKDKLLAKRSGHSPRGNNRSGGEYESSGSDRTTRMLLAVLLLFLITEFPQGLLALLTGLLGDAFFRSCYIPLADLMDFAALLNSAVNFIFYCSMSRKFRDTFYKLFHLNTFLHSRGAGWMFERRAKATLTSHITLNSTTTTRQLLASNDTEQTAV